VYVDKYTSKFSSTFHSKRLIYLFLSSPFVRKRQYCLWLLQALTCFCFLLVVLLQKVAIFHFFSGCQKSCKLSFPGGKPVIPFKILATPTETTFFRNSFLSFYCLKQNCHCGNGVAMEKDLIDIILTHQQVVSARLASPELQLEQHEHKGSQPAKADVGSLIVQQHIGDA
jgi:membrane-bound metal-dependent hydrolase YbcI (DUF457 family)